MKLRDLMVDTKSAWVNYPGLDGFEVEVVNLGREKLVAIRKSCIETKMDRKSKAMIDTLDEKKFIRKFTDNTIKNWRGLKLSYVEQLMLVDISAEDSNKELEYDQDNAELLVSNSADFDTWLNEVVFDLENFRTSRDGGTVDEAGAVAE
jgi:hypothetical protein